MSQEIQIAKSREPFPDAELPLQIEELSNDLRVFTRASLELERQLTAIVGTKAIAKLRTPSEVAQGTVEKVSDGWALLVSHDGRNRLESNVRLDTVQAYSLHPAA